MLGARGCWIFVCLAACVGEQASATDAGLDASSLPDAAREASAPVDAAPPPVIDAAATLSDSAPVDACEARSYFPDEDGDGFGDPRGEVYACAQPPDMVLMADDCDDACATCHPGGRESCDPGLRDEDCSGAPNEGCECAEGSSRTCPGVPDAGECVAGSQLCSSSGTWEPCTGTVPPAAELCDGLDQDCDGTADGPGAVCPAVAHGVPTCSAGSCEVASCDAGWADCNAAFSDGCETPGTCSACPPGCPWGCSGTECRAAVAVSLGNTFTCALRDDGQVACWGGNDAGELGDPSFGAPPIPRVVPGLSGVIAIGSGWSQTCAILADDRMRCWGSSSSYELGTAVRTSLYSPTEISLPAAPRQVGGGIGFMCVRLVDGTVACSGMNSFGQMGNGGTTPNRVFERVPDLADVVDISSGVNYSCAVRRDGSVWCWGSCSSHRCGGGSAGDIRRPRAMLGVTTATRVITGDEHTCVLLGDGSVMCVGRNSEGQMGDGGTDRVRMSASLVPGLGPVARLEADTGNYAILEGGEAFVWGVSTRLGATFVENPAVPTANPRLDGMTWLAATLTHACGIRAGTVYCWGGGVRLGDGIFVTSVEPTPTLPPL